MRLRGAGGFLTATGYGRGMSPTAYPSEVRALRDEPALVSFAGELDMFVAPDVTDRLNEALGREALRVVVDLSEVTMLDSTALAALVRAARRMLARGGELSLVCSDRALLGILDVTGCTRLFRIWSSLGEAIARPGLPEPVGLETRRSS